MKNIASKLGITSKTTTYAARHSFATILQGSGGSTSFISEALGHSIISEALGHSNVLTTKAIWQGLKMNPKRNH